MLQLHSANQARQEAYPSKGSKASAWRGSRTREQIWLANLALTCLCAPTSEVLLTVSLWSTKLYSGVLGCSSPSGKSNRWYLTAMFSQPLWQGWRPYPIFAGLQLCLCSEAWSHWMGTFAPSIRMTCIYWLSMQFTNIAVRGTTKAHSDRQSHGMCLILLTRADLQLYALFAWIPQSLDATLVTICATGRRSETHLHPIGIVTLRFKCLWSTGFIHITINIISDLSFAVSLGWNHVSCCACANWLVTQCIRKRTERLVQETQPNWMKVADKTVVTNKQWRYHVHAKLTCPQIAVAFQIASLVFWSVGCSVFLVETSTILLVFTSAQMPSILLVHLHDYIVSIPFSPRIQF